MPAIQSYSNSVFNQLSAAITSTSATTLTYTGGGFPSTGSSANQFVIKIDDELMLVTNNNTGTSTLTVTRGVEGTSAVTHLIDAPIFQPLTMQALLALVVQLHGGTVIGSRRGVNFVDGGGITWTLTDDPTNSKCDISGAISITDFATYIHFTTSIAPSGAANNSIFLDNTNSNKLSFKDGSGTMHTINLTP